MPLKTPVGPQRDPLLALLDAQVRRALGAVDLPWWLIFNLEVAPDVASRRLLLNFRVTLEEHTRIVNLDRPSMRVGASASTSDLDLKRHLRLPERRCLESSVPIDCAALISEEAMTLVEEALGHFLRVAAPRLYEFDPRMGWTPGEDEDVLPESPLFDPPVPFSRTGQPAEFASAVAPRVVSPRCPFCNRPHTSSNPSVWAGGNLLWVHPACWGGRS